MADANPASSAKQEELLGGRAVSPRLLGFIIFVTGLTAVFSGQLWTLFTTALDSDLNSYIVLIPFVSLYFFYLEGSKRPREYSSSIAWAFFPLFAGLILVGLVVGGFVSTSLNNRVAMFTLSYVCFLWGGGFIFLGHRWMAAAAFPMLFLIFLVPLPDQAVDTLEMGLRLASAEAANVLFVVSGTPALKTGTIFQLPGITVEVAQECSGIRSTWILFITSLVAAQLFLTKPVSRLVLVASVVPLGILRNGFRILVIGLLCVHVDPHMIHSIIHRKGGPIFFALSLIPLLGFLWVLRRKELRAGDAQGAQTSNRNLSR